VLRQVTVELKNDLAIKGTLHSVDQHLNIKLNNIRIVNEQKYPHLVRRSPVLTPPGAAMHLEPPNVGPWGPCPTRSARHTLCCSPGMVPVASTHIRNACPQMSVRNCFIRGSVVRYVQVTAVCRGTASSAVLAPPHPVLGSTRHCLLRSST